MGRTPWTGKDNGKAGMENDREGERREREERGKRSELCPTRNRSSLAAPLSISCEV